MFLENESEWPRFKAGSLVEKRRVQVPTLQKVVPLLNHSKPRKTIFCSWLPKCGSGTKWSSFTGKNDINNITVYIILSIYLSIYYYYYRKLMYVGC